LALDQRGGSLKKSRENSFIARAFPNIDDIDSLENVFRLRKINMRDDEFVLERNRDLMIRDAQGLFIMYEEAVKDLEKREDELMKMGSVFVEHAQERKPDINVDRMLVIEDLYESECWYQDGKRKLISALMECYEHTVCPKIQQKYAYQIIKLIRSKCSIDMNAKYFSESYAQAIIAMELNHSLLRSVISHNLNKEREYVHQIYADFNPSKKPVTSLAPERIIEDSDMQRRLSPASHRIGFLDIYRSLENIIEVYQTIDASVRDFCHSLQMDQNIATRMTARRVFLQQALIEWKLLSEEEKIAQRLHIQAGQGRAELEQHSTMIYPEEIIQRWNSVGESVLQVAGLQIGIIDLFYELSHQLHITDCLKVTYLKQRQSIGLPSEEPIKPLFIDEKLYPSSNSPKKPNELLSLRSELMQDCSVAVEFTPDLTPKRIREYLDVLDVSSLNIFIEELQATIAYQAFVNHVLKTYTSLNGHMLDDYLIANAIEANVFMTETDDETDIPIKRIYTDDVSVESLASMFRSYNELFEPIRELFADRYRELSTTVQSEESETLITSKIRNLQFRMIKQFMTSVMKEISPDILRVQINEVSSEIRRYASLLPPNSLDLGKDNDSVTETARYFNTSQKVATEFNDTKAQKGGCLIAKDGGVVNPFYIPHYKQVLDYKARQNKNSPSDVQGQLTKQLNSMRKLLMIRYWLMLFDRAEQHMNCTGYETLTRPLFGLEEFSQKQDRLKSELTHLANPESSVVIERFLLNVVHMKYFNFLEILDLFKHELIIDAKSSESIADPLNIVEQYRNALVNGQKPVDGQDEIISQIESCVNYGFKKEVASKYKQVVQSFTAPFTSLPLKHYLFGLSDVNRQNVSALIIHQSLQYDDHLHVKHILRASHPELALSALTDFAELSYSLLALRSELLEIIRREMNGGLDVQSYKWVWNVFDHIVAREARRLYNRELQEENRRIMEEEMEKAMEEKRAAAGENEAIEDLDEEDEEEAKSKMKSKLKKKNEFEFRQRLKKQILMELNKLLIIKSMQHIKNDINQLRNDIQRGEKRVYSEEEIERRSSPVANEYNHEEDDDPLSIYLFRNFLQHILRHSARTRTKSENFALTIHEHHLLDAIDTLGQRLLKYQLAEFQSIHDMYGQRLDHLKRLTLKSELQRSSSNLKYQLSLKSFNRRVQSEVSDANYDLVFRVDELRRENHDLKTQLSEVKDIAEKEVRTEYEDLIRRLSRELITIRERFTEYRRHFYKELDEKFNSVKEETLVSLKGQKGAPTALQKKALAVAIEHNELNKLKRLHAESRGFESKLMTMNKLKMLSLQGKYEKRLRDAEDDVENSEKQYWSSKAKIEERENMLRREMVKLQSELSNANMEIQELRKEVNVQKRNKQRLRIWKVKNKQLLDELEQKVKNYEKWNKHDVDKIILEKDQMAKQLSHYHQMENKLSKQSGIIEKRSKRQVETMKKALKQERSLKARAFAQLEQTRSFDSDAQYQKRYEDAMGDLQLAMKEINVLRDAMERAGLEVPQLNASQFNASSRQSSAKGTSRLIPSYKSPATSRSSTSSLRRPTTSQSSLVSPTNRKRRVSEPGSSRARSRPVSRKTTKRAASAKFS